MSKILSGFREKRTKYKLWRLVDSRIFEDIMNPEHQIVCDIDKTYLETNFETLLGIAKIALFEDAHNKITVSGAKEVLSAFRWGGDCEKENVPIPRGLHFVSSSPPQLRNVLREKMLLDTLDWTSDTFKDQSYNLKHGRFDLLRQQLAFKTAAILKLIGQYGIDGSSFYFIGDSAESDPYAYLGIKFYAEGRLSQDGLREYLLSFGVEDFIADEIFHELPKIHKTSVPKIFIRSLPGYLGNQLPPMAQHLDFFDHYLEIAFILEASNLIDKAELQKIVACYEEIQVKDSNKETQEPTLDSPSEEEILEQARSWKALIDKS